MLNTEAPRISHIGTKAMLFEAPGDFSLAVQKRIWSLADEASGWNGISEVVPGVTNLLLIFDTPPRNSETYAADMLSAWSRLPPKEMTGRTHHIPVMYGGKHGTDLPRVCEYAGLPPEEVIRIHSTATYTVACLGSSPGFGYLHGLDKRIFMPRKTTPSLRMQAGTVTIGGMQAGISVTTGPNGWNSIGFTLVKMFDPGSPSPAILAAGDIIRFEIEKIEL